MRDVITVLKKPVRAGVWGCPPRSLPKLCASAP